MPKLLTISWPVRSAWLFTVEMERVKRNVKNNKFAKCVDIVLIDCFTTRE